MKYLIKDSLTNYQILVGNHDKNAVFAVNLLQKYLCESTGVKLEIVTEKTSKNAIYVGCKQFATHDGRVKCIIENDDIYLDGDGDFGSSDATIEFLTRTIGFDVVDIDRVFVRECKEIKLVKPFEVIPSFKYRFATYGWIRNDENTRKMMRLTVPNEVLMTGDIYHNSLEILKYGNQEIKDIYLNKNKNQICYSNEEARDIFTNNLKNIINEKYADSNLDYFMLGMEDNQEWCECEKCNGKNQSDIMIEFINYVAQSINCEREKPIKFLVFAYYNTLKAPTIECDKNVGVYYAPIKSRFRKQMSSKDNKNYYRFLKGWNKKTSTLFAWTYSFYTRRNFVMYDTYSSMSKNYKVLSKNNAIGLYDQTVSYANDEPGFAHLKAYVQYHLLWNNKLNINKLIKTYFDRAYSEFSQEMYGIFKNTRHMYNKLYKLENINPKSDISEENPDKYSEIGQCIDKFESLKDKRVSNDFKLFLEHTIHTLNKIKEKADSNLKDKIDLENLSYKFLYINLFDKENKDSFSQLYENLKAHNIEYFQEGKKVVNIDDIRL